MDRILRASKITFRRITNLNPGSLLASDRSKAVVLVLFLLNVFKVGVLCRILYSFVVFYM